MPIPGKASALVPLPACSTNARSGRERDGADGNAPPSGGCCTTRLTRGVPSMAKPSFVRVGESHAASASVACAAVTVLFGNGLVRRGSRSLVLRQSEGGVADQSGDRDLDPLRPRPIPKRSVPAAHATLAPAARYP